MSLLTVLAVSGAAAAGIPQANPGRGHWSLQPVKRPDIPRVENSRLVRNAVDRFILAKLEAMGLTPVGLADRRTLIRRATFDLIGLPPTPDEVESFLRDRSHNAFEKVVDRLLASPHYGERWGRHWLDVARYADTSGGSTDQPVPGAYRYRNYVIDSFNRDLPYDQFLTEQIAGDLLTGPTREESHEKIIATGYLAVSRRFGNSVEIPPLIIEDTIDMLGKSVLGLTISCARCHDHKYDPITSKDYYGLYGIFNSTRYPFPGAENPKFPRDLVPLATPDEVQAKLKPFQERLAALDAEYYEVKGLLEEDEALKKQSGPEALKRREEIRLAVRGRTPSEVRERRALFAAHPPPIDFAYAVFEGKGQNAHVQRSGDSSNLGEEVPRGFPRILGGQQLPAGVEGSGRLQLAQWLTDPENPLTARVMVNRIWHFHFGKGLVETTNDFGTRGIPPTHPELLDYLAVRFMQSGWSIKSMHRLLMLSNTYRLASIDDPRCVERDATNALLWKFNRRRLDAESIRDAMLFVSGEWDSSPAGPHPFPPEHTWSFSQHRPFVADYETRHRSVYLMQPRIRKQPFLSTFDGADTNASTGNRRLTTTPLQALLLMNNRFVHEQSDGFAYRLMRSSSNESVAIKHAYQLAFGRPPSNEELRESRLYLQRYRQELNKQGAPAAQQTRQTWASFARALFNSNEFVYID